LNSSARFRITASGEVQNVSTILVVDDEPTVRRMVALVLENEGFCVLTAEGGQEAIDLAHTHAGTIDLLVTDVKMPEMDGCTLAGRLQAEHPELPVLLISGFAENEPEVRDLKYPMLPKPFSLESLLCAVRNLLQHPVAIG